MSWTDRALGASVLVVSTSLSAIVGLGCQKATPEPTPPTAPVTPGATTATSPPGLPPVGHGSISGVVKLTGTPPVMAPTRRDADPFCARTPMKEEEVVVGPGGGLKNAVVHITGGLSGHYDAPGTPAAVDQTACMYRPRVQAAMAGQALAIRNGDQTLHNVHGYNGPHTLFNQAEIPGLPPITRKVGAAGDVLKLKCDVHPWMTGYVVVTDNPFSAVTDDDGKFHLTGVPPGTYTLEIWHERYGTKAATVTVADDKPAEVSFQYDAH